MRDWVSEVPSSISFAGQKSSLQYQKLRCHDVRANFYEMMTSTYVLTYRRLWRDRPMTLTYAAHQSAEDRLSRGCQRCAVTGCQQVLISVVRLLQIGHNGLSCQPSSWWEQQIFFGYAWEFVHSPCNSTGNINMVLRFVWALCYAVISLPLETMWITSRVVVCPYQCIHCMTKLFSQVCVALVEFHKAQLIHCTLYIICIFVQMHLLYSEIGLYLNAINVCLFDWNLSWIKMEWSIHLEM